MILKKKLLDKYLIKLRENINNKKKILKFKKKKWEKFVFYAKKKIKFYNRYKPKDQRIYSVSRFPSKGLSYKKRFRNNSQAAKRMNLFYGGLNKRVFKKVIKTINFRNNKKIILEKFEKRIDVILLRSKFCTSIQNSKQLISHGKILVNNKITKDKSYNLKRGDIISINPKISKRIRTNIITNYLNSNIWPLPPKYLIINYKTMEIVFGQIENNHNVISTNFLFNLKLEKILENYKYY